MSTSIQILALCLAFVGSLIIAVALAAVVLEVILVMMCRGLPTPQLEHGQGNGMPHSRAEGTKVMRVNQPNRSTVRIRSRAVTARPCQGRDFNHL